MAFLDMIRWGWHVVYAVEIEGVPVLWSESRTGHAAAGYAEAATADGAGVLVIDKSGEIGQLVDRATGIGVGQPLTFQVLDCPHVSTYLRRYLASANLTANLTAAAAAATVDSTTPFGGAGTSGLCWIEKEAIAFTVLNGTTLTLTSRGLYGSIAASHSAVISARLVSDLPRWWRGRQVRLWVYACDPTGYVCADRIELWRGHISTGPDREGASWQFEALSLDRRLDDPCIAPSSGTVVDTQQRFPVYSWELITIAGEAPSMSGGVAALFKFECDVLPYTGLAAGTMLTREEQIQAIQTAWVAARAATVNSVSGFADLGTWLGSLEMTTYGSEFGQVSLMRLNVTALSQRATYWQIKANGEPCTEQGGGYVHSPNGPITLWRAYGSLVGGAVVPGKEFQAPLGPALTLNLGDPDTAPSATGWLMGGSGAAIWYSQSDQAGALCTFSDLRQSPKGLTASIPAAWVVGTEISITGEAGGIAFPAFAMTLLESSGDGTRGTYDDLPSGSGYGFDGNTGDTSALDESSFAKFPAPGNALICHSPATEKASFVDVCGGMLAAQQCAVVATRDSTDAVRLRLVDVSTLGSGYLRTITDADLLTTAGEPVTMVRRRDVPNAVVLEPTAKSGQGEAGTSTFIDAPGVKEQGRRDLHLKLPIDSIDYIKGTQWAASILQSVQTAQAVEIRVVPWLDIHPGDLVRLTTEHYAVWTWSTGVVGYDGPARCVGERVDPVSLATVLTLLIDAVQSASLSPAALVESADDPLDPGEILISNRYYAHMRQTLDENGGSFSLRHYIPGDGAESGGGHVEVGDAQLSGTQCVLTIAGDTLGYNIEAMRSYLTLPVTAACTTYQTAFAHDGDGSKWL